MMEKSGFWTTDHLGIFGVVVDYTTDSTENVKVLLFT